jgi:hypothetical protein
VTPTTDDRPFFFHTTKLADQFGVAFGRSMLFGNGLSALLTLMGISGGLVVLFVLVPLVAAGGHRSPRWLPTLAYFGALGAGFMLIEVAILQRFVLLLGHPVYSLTVTLFSLLLGTGLGAAWSRRVADTRLVRAGLAATVVIALLAWFWMPLMGPVLDWAMPLSRPARILVAVAALLPVGFILGIPMPTGLRLLGRRSPQMVPWAWGMNGAFSVVGATLAIFVAMNWGFQFTLAAASGIYLTATMALAAAEPVR